MTEPGLYDNGLCHERVKCYPDEAIYHQEAKNRIQFKHTPRTRQYCKSEK